MRVKFNCLCHFWLEEIVLFWDEGCNVAALFWGNVTAIYVVVVRPFDLK